MARGSSARHYAVLVVLILAGEVIFSLPFHIPRFFRPSMLEVFQLSHTQLGDIFAVYGVVAFLAYFPGGALADRFPARTLMSLSLATTALGGFYLYTLPGTTGIYFLFAYWGCTSILLFWAALIKATREWGGAREQGVAFGMLEGGRGFLASLFSSVAVYLLARQLVGGVSNAAGLQSVILFYTGITLLSAVVVWFTLPHNTPQYSRQAAEPEAAEQQPHWRRVLADSRVYLQAGVVICAYCGYKSLDNYGVYAVEVLQMTPLASAELTTYASYSRPAAAVAAGLLADRWSPSRLITVLFIFACIAFFVMSWDAVVGSASAVVMANLLITFVAVYALRGIYFSLVEESGLKASDTGTAVGLISVVGFAPDVFFGALTGRLLDANPGAVGFQHYFVLMACISIAGMLFALALSWRLRSQHPTVDSVSA
ncbi:Inner membrane protein YihN [Halioglobus japonicus]|nr:Inner membrane protein YihN [Halioglobus japonicus]